MIVTYPVIFTLSDGTQVAVYKQQEDCYEFFLTRLNSEKHNFYLKEGKIEESYETRFDKLQEEAVTMFNSLLTNQN